METEVLNGLIALALVVVCIGLYQYMIKRVQRGQTEEFERSMDRLEVEAMDRVKEVVYGWLKENASLEEFRMFVTVGEVRDAMLEVANYADLADEKFALLEQYCAKHFASKSSLEQIYDFRVDKVVVACSRLIASRIDRKTIDGLIDFIAPGYSEPLSS